MRIARCGCLQRVLSLGAPGIGPTTYLDKVNDGLAAQRTMSEDCLWPLCKSCHNGQVQTCEEVGLRVDHSSQEQAFPKRYASVDEILHI